MDENNHSPQAGAPASPPSESATLKVLSLVAAGFHARERARRRRHWVLGATIALAFTWWVGASIGDRWAQAHPQERVVVIPVVGPIEAGGDNGGDRLVPIVRAACQDASVKGLVFRINSPGGSAGEAERIGAAMQLCRQAGHTKPVLAVIDGLGASAAYLLAVDADQVVASRYAMVGSIGTVMKQVNASSLGERLGVREDVYASGALKAWGSNLRSNSPEQSAMLQSVVDRAAVEFANQVKERRGARLKPSPDLFTGRVWLASDARDRGLIDQVGVVDQVMDEHFAGLPTQVMARKPSWSEQLGLRALVADVLLSSTASPQWQ